MFVSNPLATAFSCEPHDVPFAHMRVVISVCGPIHAPELRELGHLGERAVAYLVVVER